MKKLLQFLSYVLVACVASVATFWYASIQRYQTSPKLENLERLIQERFIGEVDTAAMEDAAADAMVNALGDRWSYYLSAEEYRAHQEQMANAYVGIGVTILKEPTEAGFQVAEVTPGASAEEAGIRAGDVLTKVEGQSVLELGLTETGSRIRGEEGTQVKLTVLRGTEEQEITVTRKSIRTPVATGTLLANSIGLIHIENFDSRCYEETVAAIESLRKQGAKSLIFDVRNNPGGYKSELVKLLDYLLPEGELFRSELYTGKVTVDRSDKTYLDMPMAVLVNGDSYSAAEFFAAALREYEAAVVAGEQTCGKGYFQSVFELGDGTAVGLSIGKYYTPKGVCLAGVGITPDVVVEVDDETAAKIYYGQLTPEEDPQIQAAVKALLAG